MSNLGFSKRSLDLTPLPCPWTESRDANASLAQPLVGQTVAFDLDETLLVNSCVGHNYWSELKDFPYYQAWRRRSVRRVVHRLQRTRFNQVVELLFRLAPQYRAPVVEVAFRRGALGLLCSLRSIGAELVLITASTRQRVDYLFQRMPWFAELFRSASGQLQVICREEIATTTVELKNQTASSASSVIEKCERLHRTENPSLAHKTPALVQRVLTNPDGYRVLVDDNIATRNCFNDHGLQDCLIVLDGHAPCDSDAIEQVSEQLSQRLSSSSLRDIKNSTCFSSRPFRLEDPYYLPLLNHTLEISTE